MSQIFHPSMNTISRMSIFGAVFFIGAIIYVINLVERSPYGTEAGVVRTQPVQFDHEHHVRECGIDCRYCHTSVEHAPFAGIPSTKICMNCHAYLWDDAPLLAPVRESFRDELRPLEWTRVHDLPDFATFDHSIHVHKGIACVTCHGRVDQMPLMWREHTLHMEWCLECHRNPERYVRPRDQVFAMDWTPEAAVPALEAGDGQAADQGQGDLADPPRLAAQLLEEYNIESKTSCSVCHR